MQATHLQVRLKGVTSIVCCYWWSLFTAVWELYTGGYAFQRLQHPGQYFEAVVLHDLRPNIPQGMHHNMALFIWRLLCSVVGSMHRFVSEIAASVYRRMDYNTHE